MKLRRRRQGKKAQALDVFATVVKSLAELHLAQRAGKRVGKGAKSVSKGASKGVKKASRAKCLLKSTTVRIAGGAAVVGGAGALLAKKLKGGDPEPIYTPPAPTEPVAVATAPEVDAVVAAAADAAANGEPSGAGESQGPAADESGIVVGLMPEPAESASGETGAGEAAEPPGEAAEEVAPDAAEPPSGAEEPAPADEQPGSGLGSGSP